jgi:hypothetical protein
MIGMKKFPGQGEADLLHASHAWMKEMRGQQYSHQRRSLKKAKNNSRSEP